MATTYQLKTFADILAAIREEVGIGSTDTTNINRLKRDVNIVYGELKAESRWWWLQGTRSLSLPAYISTGTASVATNSSAVTLTTGISDNKVGWRFAVDGYSEIYTIESCNDTAVKLNTPFTGTTNTTASYRIWTDNVALPTDCKETIEVWHDYYSKSLENAGFQEFRRIRALAPRAEGLPTTYHSADFNDPLSISTIASLPALTSRASVGVVKTLIFASGVPSTVIAGSRIQVSASSNSGYNGDWVVASVSTTTLTNDTVKYIGTYDENETAVADSALLVRAISEEAELQRYRKLYYHPAQYSTRVTLHVDYVKEAAELTNDSDEPAMPAEDRVVLLYGALHRAWSRERNPEEAARNLNLYQNKLAKMQGKMQDNFDKPKLSISSRYLGAKRSSARRLSSDYGPMNIGTGGGGAASTPTGTPDTVAIFNGSGELVGRSAVSPTELDFLDGVTSGIQTQLNTNATAITTEAVARASADTTLTTNLNAHIADTAAPHGAVATNTASRIVTRDSSGNFAAGTITASLTGNVTGNCSGTSATFTGNLTGDITSTGMATTITAGIIDNADINASAAIARSKLASGTNYRILANNSSGVMSENAALTAKNVVIADTNGQLSGIAPGSANNVLLSNGTDWTSAAAPTPNLAVVSQSSNYTATLTDDVILCDASGGAFTITLPAAASSSGKQYLIKKTDSSANSVTIDGNASETIDGATTIKLSSQYESATIVCDASNWQIRVRDMATYKYASSGVKTPGASGDWHTLTTNSITLTPGDWIIYHRAYFDESGGATYTDSFYSLCTANGGDSASEPALLSASGSATVYTFMNNRMGRLSVADHNERVATDIATRVNINTTLTVYIVTSSSQTTSANARVSAAIWAERIR